ncbi:hypothetical protein DEM91_10155 [Prevotella sp. TCVGH]|jgi:hypothetical protein|uniref:O-antigen ligase family protein n=1 Tax=Prevotella sp. TCVGH TaxID=2182433 RepID=UPI00201E032E|nr:O-antigen ligase family protein [Prevotella sp. TCVGH]MCL6748969.1 hypothetical protein [Prevotella sp. TCVGH]
MNIVCFKRGDSKDKNTHKFLKQYTNYYLISISILFISINVSFSLITLDFIKYQILYLGVIAWFVPSLLHFISALTHKKKSFIISVGERELVFSLFVIWIIINSIIKRIPANEISKLIIIFVAFFQIVIATRKITETFDESILERFFIKGLFALGVYQSIFGILQYCFDEDKFHIYKTLVTGSIIYPNSYGLFMVISFSSLIVLIQETSSKRDKIILVMFLPLFLFAIFTNLSRGAIFSAILSLCVIYYLLNFHLKSVKTKSVGKRVYVISLFLFAISVLFLILFNMNIESSYGRIRILRMIYPMLKDNFFTGIGYNNFAYEFLNYQEAFLQKKSNISLGCKAAEISTPNNQFLFLSLELGVVGGLLFFVYFLIILYQSYKKICFSNLKYRMWFLFSVLTLFINSFFDTIFQSIVIIFLFFYIIALIPDSLRVITIKSYVMKCIFLFIFVLFGSVVTVSALKHYRESKSYKYECMADTDLSNAMYESAICNCYICLDIDSTSLRCKSILGRALIARSTSENIMFKKESLKEGIKQLELIKNKYHSRDLYLALSYGYLKIGDNKNALLNAKKVHRMFPDQVRPKLLLGMVYFLQGDCMEAKKYTQACIKNVQTKKGVDISKVACLLLKDSINKKLAEKLSNSRLTYSFDSIMIAH